MSLKQKAVLTGLAITLVSMSACQHTKIAGGPGPGQQHGQQRGREFSIYIYTDPKDPSQCYADTAVATLWINQAQTVKWISDDDREYFVDFTKGHNSSPFSQTTFYVPKHGVVPSGKLMQSGKYYDYAIFAGKDATPPPCKPPSDPGFYVKP